MNNVTTIEDLLECAANLRSMPVIKLESSDMTIMHSIGRQVFKGTALTDRQLALMQEKLTPYKDQFINLEIDFDFAIGQLRQPLRQIDRSKYIKIIDGMIHVRFPFRKTDIISIQTCSSQLDSSEYFHQKGTHVHQFAYTELATLKLLDEFKDRSFDIDSELVEVYNEIKNIESSPEKHITGIFDGQAKNITTKLENTIKDEIGNDSVKLIDRRFRYGLNYNLDFTPKNITEDIISRKEIYFHSRPSDTKLGDVLDSLHDLDRYPILVILDKDNAENQLHSLITYYRDMVDASNQSVLFRLEDKNAGFNQLVKDRKLNNWVDKTTKIVYISKDKLPKLLVSGEWKPQTVFSFSSSLDRIVDTYIRFYCDLVVWREDTVSPFREYSRLYG
jgi:uncharacterized protein YfcZ (UPF0381/DUF406 family)